MKSSSWFPLYIDLVILFTKLRRQKWLVSCGQSHVYTIINNLKIRKSVRDKYKKTAALNHLSTVPHVLVNILSSK